MTPGPLSVSPRRGTRAARGMDLVAGRGAMQEAKIEALGGVAQTGLIAAAFVSQVEQQLAGAVPIAASRLQAIGDVAALGISKIVLQTANDLRRL